MNIMRMIVYCLGMMTTMCQSYCEYVYPVATMVDHDEYTVFLIYQKSLDHLELLMWNPITKVTNKGLLSTFTPAGLKVLADGNGFSFIDKGGRILVKSFNRRSPKSIQLYEPIKDISIIEWIDADAFYFMGKQAQRHVIFQADTNGFVYPLIQNPHIDCMHPYKIDQELFFIQRTPELHYSIARAHYPLITREHAVLDDDCYEEEVAKFLSGSQCNKEPFIASKDIRTIIDLGNQPAAFLYMLSAQEGFFVKYPPIVHRMDALVKFTYCRFFYADNGWHTQDLFEFSLPSHFFLNANDFRLYESLLPMLPRYIHGAFYFVHCDDEERLTTAVYNYNCTYKTIKRVSQLLNKEQGPLGRSCFSPLKVKSMIFYGGTLKNEDSSPEDTLPSMWINQDGFVCVDLPFVFDFQEPASL